MESKDYKLQTYKRIKNDYPQLPKLSKIYKLLNNMITQSNELKMPPQEFAKLKEILVTEKWKACSKNLEQQGKDK